MFKKRAPYLLLFIIILFASFIRLYRLDKIPAGFNYDEAMVGYNAYTLEKWGSDESGNRLPLLYVQSSVTFHQSPFFYLTAVTEKFLGVSKFSLRFTPVLFGLLDILLVYFLIKQLFKENKNHDWIALSCSFLTAISSWHIYISRSGYELTVAQFFFLSGLYLFLFGKNKLLSRPLAMILFLIAALTYRSYLIFLPLFVVMVYFVDSFRAKRKIWSWQLLLIAIFSFMLFFIAINDPRRSDTLFNGNISNLAALAQILQNFLRNYIVHFSLLLNFAPTAFDPKYWLVNRGLFYLFELPLFILGLIYLLKTKHYSLKIFLAWLFLYPVPHALTNFGYANRMSIILPWPQIIAGIGLWWLLITVPKKFWALIFAVIFFSFIGFWVDYYSYYPRKYGNFNHEGPEYVFDYLQNKKTKYNRIIISRWNTHPVFFLFFSKYDLPNYLKERKKFSVLDKTEVFSKLNNIYFVNNILDVNPEPNDLFVDKKESFPAQTLPLKIIYLQNGSEFAWVVSGRELLNKRL